MNEVANEVIGGKGSGGGGGGGISSWDPVLKPDYIQAGINKAPGTFIVVSGLTQTIDDLPSGLGLNNNNPTIFFNTHAITPESPKGRWQIASKKESEDKFTSPPTVATEAELNAIFPTPANYTTKYCFVTATGTYWNGKAVGLGFAWVDTAQGALDTYAKFQIDAKDELRKLKITPLTNPGTFGSASKTITEQVNEQGDIISIGQQDIAIPSTQVTDFIEASQDAIGGALLDTATIDLTYDDATNKISADVKDLSLTNSKIATNAGIETSKSKQATITPVLATPQDNDTQEAINNKSLGLINNLQSQISSRPIGASNGSVYYLTSQNSAIANYELLSFSPDPSALDIESVTINSTTAKASRLIHSYIANYEIGSAIVNGGNWLFNFYGYVSHLNSSRFEIDVLKRVGVTETLLFTCETTDFLQIAQISPELNIVNVETTQQDFPCNATDKIVIKIYGKTDRTQDTTITLLHSGTDYASHIHTPLIVTHNNLVGTQGGSATEKYHLTLAEYNKVQVLDTSLAGKVDKVINKSLILDSEIARLAGLPTIKNVKKIYVSGGVNGSGNDANNGFSESSAVNTLATANTKTDGSGWAIKQLPSQLTESITFTHANLEFFGDTHRDNSGTTGTITSNPSSGSQTYSTYSFTNFSKLGSGFCILTDVSIKTALNDTGSGDVEIINSTLSTAVLTFTGAGTKRLYNCRGGSPVVNNASAFVYIGNNQSVVNPTLIAGTLALENCIVYVLQGTTLTLGTAGAIISLNNVRFIYPDSTEAVINIPTGVSYSLAGVNLYKSTSTLSGTDISSLSASFIQNVRINTLNLPNSTASQRLETNASKNVVSVAKGTADNANYSTTVGDIKANGTGSLGLLATLPRADHIHPTDTTREATANKVSTFTATPNNTNYITEKLAKDSLDLKVDKVVGKQLSTEDYTTAEKNKLAGIQDGAEVNVQANWSETNNTLDSFIQNKPTLGTVASKNVGTAIGNIQENGAVLVSLETVETDASGKFITVTKNDAYNQTFGTGTNNVARGDASYLKADTYNKTEIDAELNNKLETSFIEVANFASLPAIGEAGQMYITIDTNLQYRWSGTQYAEISPSLALGETSSTAYRGDLGKIAYDHSQSTGNPHGTTSIEISYDNVASGLTAINVKEAIDELQNEKEPTFTKNTAFNKNFGINANTVTEGNDARLGTKNIDETNIANNRIQVYNSISGKLEYQDKPLGSTNLSIANKTGTTLDITSDTGTDATIPGATTTEAGLLSAIDKIKLNNTSGTNSGDQDLSGLMVKSQNLSDVANRQTSLNNLTNTASATNEYVLTKDTATGNAIFKPAVISSNKPPLTYFVNASDIQISGTGTSATITWNAQSNAVRYKLFVKQTSLGAINIITDTPVTTVNAPTNLATVTVSQGVSYTYAILADNSVNAATDIINFTTLALISNFTLDTFDLSTGTTATLSWGSVVGAVEYRIQYQRATSLTAPTIIAGITGTSSVITGLTPSNPDDATTPYSFKLLAYNGSGQVIAETPVNTRPVFARINLRYFYDSTVNITVSTITRSSDLATCNTTANHNLKQGDVFTITNSVAPFNVSYGLVFDVPSLTSFRYVVANSGSTSSTGTLQKFENPFITWNYYKFSQYLTGFETTIKKILPRNPVAYTLSTTPVDYTAELIFPTAKYQNSGDSIAGWYLIKYHNSDDAITILADATNKNVAMQMFDGTFSYSDRQDKFLFAADDHRCYKLWHGGFAYLQTAGNDISNGANFYRLNTNLTENTSGVEIANRPSELSNVIQAMPVRLSLSSYTIYFDNDNQRLIYQKKDGTRKTILTYTSLGLNNIFGFTVSAGGGSASISGSSWYTVTNNLDTIIIANRSNASIGSYRLIFNFTAGTVVVSTVNRISDINLQTEENCFGDQIDTYFNLRTNAVQAVRYFSGSAPTLTLRLYSTPLTDLSVNTTDLTMTVPGAISQPGIGPVSVILTDGSIYWIDWGHDDQGMYRLTGNDDGLGIVKMVNMSVHPRLLAII